MFREAERRAQWHVGWSDARAAPTVSVVYRVRHRLGGGGHSTTPRGGEEVRYGAYGDSSESDAAADAAAYVGVKELRLHELEDFQSALVLVQTVGDADEQAMVEDFIRQYHLALRVLEVLSRLRDAGHFSYQGSECRFKYALNGGE
jgi:hypothetical protein